MIAYRLASAAHRAGEPEPLLEYVLAGNGVLVRAKREGLETAIPIASCEVRGLPEVEPYVRLACPVPAAHLGLMLARAREVCGAAPREVLFHLVLEQEGWRVVEPPQEATATSVRPREDAESTARALVEIHSHHSMRAFFSRTDDEDEQGFRVYGVLGSIFTKPALRLRLGLHGYFWPLGVTEVFA